MGYLEYEKLTEKVINGLAKLQGLPDSKVTHDVQIIGLSGASHQIDILWEFTIGPLVHRVLFQAKNLKDCVTMPAVMTFAGVLRDIADAKGVMVTRVGYDKGNIDKIAKAYGIELLILDDNGNVNLNNAAGPQFAARVYVSPTNVSITNFAFANAAQAHAFRALSNSVPRDQIRFYGQNGCFCSIQDITNVIYKLAFEKNMTSDGHDLTFTPDEPFIVRDQSDFEIEVRKIRARVSVGEKVILGETSLLITHLLQKATSNRTILRRR